MLTFQALIAFNDEDFESALKACDECLTICNARVSETWMEQISGTFSDEKYKYWDDEKLHAMLVRAEILFFKTALLACSSGTDLMAIAKICIFSRDSYKLFEKCLDIADIRPWKSETLRKEFLNGAKFGIGMFKVSFFDLFFILEFVLETQLMIKFSCICPCFHQKSSKSWNGLDSLVMEVTLSKNSTNVRIRKLSDLLSL